MIPIKQLIRDGNWLNLSLPEEVLFRIRVNSFAPFDYAGVDNPEKCEALPAGVLRWIMRLDVLNASKFYVHSSNLKRSLRVIDGEGYSFEVDSDGHLCCLSDFAKRSGLYALFFERLMPKVAISGAVLFRLPDEETEYSLDVAKGTLAEL